MATKVLDSYALMAFFNDESGAAEVERLLLKAEGGNYNMDCLFASPSGELYLGTGMGFAVVKGDVAELVKASRVIGCGRVRELEDAVASVGG